MKILLFIPVVIACFSSPMLVAADGPGGEPRARSCNLQAREIALRVSEEVNSQLRSAERSQIAVIAEEVCLEYAPPQGGPRRGPKAAEAKTPPESDDENALPGGLRIIDPEDRVQRPGLKRR